MNVDEKFFCSKCMRELETEGVCPFCGCDPMSTTSTVSLEEGTLLQDGRYQIGAVIGSGGFGITYAAWDYALSQPVAIKEYFPNVLCNRDTTKEDTVSSQPEHDGLYQIGLLRFSREARILSTLQNVSSVVTVFDWFEANNTAYIVMQFVRGIPLDQYVKENSISPQQLITMMRDIVDGLILVHNQGILHRDISPGNILVQDDGSLKLIDFGAATVEERRAQGKDQTVIFNRKYAPLEQYDENGLQGPWTDVYALSATLYALITGEPPIESVARKGRDSLKTLSEQNIHLKRWQEKAIMDGLILRPEKRIQNMEIFRSVLYHLPLPEEERNRRRIIARAIVASIAASIISVLVTVNFTLGFHLGDHIRYSLRRDGFHAVSYSGKTDTLMVPEQRLGIRVTAIDTGAFQAAEELENLSLPGTVHSVGMFAFNECSKLRTVVLKEGVDELLPQSFAGCSNLQAVYVPSSLKIFSAEAFSGTGERFVLVGSPDNPSAGLAVEFGLNYAQIETVEEETGIVVTKYNTNQASARIPDIINGKPVIGIDSGVNGVSVFPTEVTSVVLPKYLQRIGDYAFFETEIKDIIIPDEVQEIGEFAFSQSQLVSIHLPYSVRKVGQGAFQTCIRLAEVSLSPGMGEIPQGCFEGATDLTDVTIPEGITEIGLLAFSRCKNLKSLALPEGVTIINQLAFQDCVSLKTLYLPESLLRIHPSALSGCDNTVKLVGYDFAEYFADHYDYQFYDLRKDDPNMQITEKGNLIVRDKTKESETTVLPSYSKDTVVKQILKATALKSKTVILPSEVERVATQSFYANQFLESISAPSTLRRIGFYSFALCERLKNVELQEGVEEIGSEAFLGCTGLESIQIPESVKSLGDGTFENCVNLTSANIPASLVILENDIFANCGFQSFTVPGSLTKCRTSFYGCKQLKSVIVEEGVRTLWGTFADCDALEEVYLPESIEQISRSTFLGCSHLRNVWIYSDDVELDYVHAPLYHFESKGYYDSRPQGEKVFLEKNHSAWLFSDSPGIILHGYRGSSTQVYAQEHGIAFMEIPDAREREIKDNIGFVSNKQIYTDEQLRTMIIPQGDDPAERCWGKFRYAYGYGFEDLEYECLDAYAHAGKSYDMAIAHVTRLFLEQQEQHGYEAGAPIAFFEDNISHPTLQVGDIIVEIDGKRLSNNDDFSVLKKSSESDSWEYTVLRENENGLLERKNVTVDSEAPLCATQNLSPQTFERL